MSLLSLELRTKYEGTFPLLTRRLKRVNLICPQLTKDIHAELHRTVDAVVTLGGDGTILHATSLFSSTYVPPVLSFSLGTLGFLLPFSMSMSQFS